MKTYGEIIELALEKGYRPRAGKSTALRQNYNEEDVLIRLTSIQKWLRDEQGIECWIEPKYEWKILSRAVFKRSEKEYTSYESAFSEGIYESLKLIK